MVKWIRLIEELAMDMLLNAMLASAQMTVHNELASAFKRALKILSSSSSSSP